MFDVLGSLVWRRQLGHVVDDPPAHPVAEHGLDDLTEDRDHPPAQPLTPRPQVKHFLQQQQHDPQRRVVTLPAPDDLRSTPQNTSRGESVTSGQHPRTPAEASR